MNNPITIQAIADAPIEVVWHCWISAEHIIHWNAASDDWHTPRATSDFKIGGTFSYRMEAKDGSFGFDLNGRFNHIEEHRFIAYSLEDDRKVEIEFEAKGDQTLITQRFEAENINPRDLQQTGWQAILNNFVKYAAAQQGSISK
jgi:uncharacterized protein YndB with AHSA1/START domain